MDLTSRECAKLLGGVIGGLVHLADVDEVRAAVRFWAESEDGWKAMRGTKLAMSVDPH